MRSDAPVSLKTVRWNILHADWLLVEKVFNLIGWLLWWRHPATHLDNDWMLAVCKVCVLLHSVCVCLCTVYVCVCVCIHSVRVCDYILCVCVHSVCTWNNITSNEVFLFSVTHLVVCWAFVCRSSTSFSLNSFYCSTWSLFLMVISDCVLLISFEEEPGVMNSCFHYRKLNRM